MKHHEFESEWPEDIIYGILLRLQVKSLLRLKIMGKRWLALIESAPFVEAHLHGSRLSSAIFTIHRDYEDFHRKHEYGVTLLCLGEDTTSTLDFRKFPFEIFDTKGRDCFETVMAGSSNGLLCVCYFDGKLGNHVVVLCNPMTRQYRTLPSPLFCGPRVLENHSVWGFEFVAETNDYKVLRFLPYRDETGNVIPKAELFSLSTGSWKEINNFPMCTFWGNYSPLVFKGNWYGVVYESGIHGFILCFNFRDEIFWRIDSPPNSLEWNLDMFVYGDSFAMFADNKDDSCDIWIMKNDCWTKLFSNFTIVDNNPSCRHFIHPVGFWETTNFLSKVHAGSASEVLYVCDPLGQILTIIRQGQREYISPAFNFTESLVAVPMS